MAEGSSTAERLASAYKRLVPSAQILNAASDEFGKPIRELDIVLQQLNIGLDTWEKISGGEDEYGGYWRREVGYVKTGDGSWGLAIQMRVGHQSWDADQIENWRFNDAPRSFRIEALDKLPDLLEEIINNAEKTVKKLKEKTAEAQELARVLKQTADEVKKQKETTMQPKKERK